LGATVWTETNTTGPLGAWLKSSMPHEAPVELVASPVQRPVSDHHGEMSPEIALTSMKASTAARFGMSTGLANEQSRLNVPEFVHATSLLSDSLPDPTQSSQVRLVPD